jgi:hypothetical protein
VKEEGRGVKDSVCEGEEICGRAAAEATKVAKRDTACVLKIFKDIMYEREMRTERAGKWHVRRSSCTYSHNLP